MIRREKLSADAIVQMAMVMIEEAGVKGFSMRKLAARLNVDPMAIYHHHANKAALIKAVVTRFMDEFHPPKATKDWRQDLRALCAELRALALRHPETFRTYELYDDWVIGELRMKEAFFQTLLSAGFSRRATVRATRLLIAYTEAYAIDEIDGWLDVEDQQDLAQRLAEGPFPASADLIDEIVKPDVDADFAFGLDVLLDGLATARERADQPP